MPLVVPITAAVADWRARRWLKRNPGATFADYYVALNQARTAGGRPHPTLGKAGYSTSRKHVTTWTGDTFRNQGRDHWSVYLDQGLEPSMRTVDYGCGSLRLGQHAISYLDPDRYCGVDPSMEFIADGLSLLDPAMIAAKRPWVDQLADENLDKIREWKPEFIFSNAVLQHVPPTELGTYFQRLGKIIGQGCKAVIMFPCATRETRIKAMSWAYPQARLELAARECIPNAAIRFTPLPRGYEGLSGGGRRLMIIRRDASLA